MASSYLFEVHACPGKADEAQILGERGTRAGSGLWSLVKKTHSPTTEALLPELHLLRDVEMHRPAPGNNPFILKAGAKPYIVPSTMKTLYLVITLYLVHFTHWAEQGGQDSCTFSCRSRARGGCYSFVMVLYV